MTMNLGLKRSLTTCKDYPALLLMPTFSLWAFGSSEKKSYKNCEGSSNFGVSFTSTSINTFITCIGMIVSFIYLYLNLNFTSQHLTTTKIPIIFAPLFITSIILVAIIFCIKNFVCCSCSCCCEPCLPMTEFTSIFKKQENFLNVIPMNESLNTNEIIWYTMCMTNTFPNK